MRDGFKAFGDSDNLKRMLVITAVAAAAAFTGGAAVTALGIQNVAFGFLVGAVVGAATGAVVGGLGYETLDIGTFKDGAIAGAITGAIAGGLAGARAANQNSVTKSNSREPASASDEFKKLRKSRSFIDKIRDFLVCKIIRPIFSDEYNQCTEWDQGLKDAEDIVISPGEPTE